MAQDYKISVTNVFRLADEREREALINEKISDAMRRGERTNNIILRGNGGDE